MHVNKQMRSGSTFPFDVLCCFSRFTHLKPFQYSTMREHMILTTIKRYRLNCRLYVNIRQSPLEESRPIKYIVDVCADVFTHIVDLCAST